MAAGWDTRPPMAILKWLLVLALVFYGGIGAVLYFAQRAMMYLPDTARTPPAAAGLPEAEEVMLATADGERVIAWHVPPRGNKTVVVYFHGYGASVSLSSGRFKDLHAYGPSYITL